MNDITNQLRAIAEQLIGGTITLSATYVASARGGGSLYEATAASPQAALANLIADYLDDQDDRQSVESAPDPDDDDEAVYRLTDAGRIATEEVAPAQPAEAAKSSPAKRVTLTGRDNPLRAQIAGLYAEGLTTPQIAGRLGLARSTVYRYIGIIRANGNGAADAD